VAVHEGRKGPCLKACVKCPMCGKKESVFREPTKTWCVSNLTHLKGDQPEKGNKNIQEMISESNSQPNNSESSTIVISENEDDNLLTLDELSNNTESNLLNLDIPNNTESNLLNLDNMPNNTESNNNLVYKEKEIDFVQGVDA